MWNLFKKNKKELPTFEELLNSDLRNKYFHRLSPWDWVDKKAICVFDVNSPRVVTLDPWPQLIYLAADGQQTVTEFVHEMANSYHKKTPIPKELDSTILSVLAKLAEDKLINFANESVKLSREITLPKSNH